MESKLGEELKKVLLAGIGATAMTAEKSADLLKELVEKGELTVEQGKVLNQELRHTVKEKTQEVREKVQEKTKEMGDEAEVANLLKGLSEDQMGQLKDLLRSFKEDTQEEQ